MCAPRAPRWPPSWRRRPASGWSPRLRGCDGSGRRWRRPGVRCAGKCRLQRLEDERTPSAFVWKRWESSAVIVTAWRDRPVPSSSAISRVSTEARLGIALVQQRQRSSVSDAPAVRSHPRRLQVHAPNIPTDRDSSRSSIIARGSPCTRRRATAHATRPVGRSWPRAPKATPLALGPRVPCLLGVSRCYVADLDAIAGGPPQRDLLGASAGPRASRGRCCWMPAITPWRGARAASPRHPATNRRRARDAALVRRPARSRRRRRARSLFSLDLRNDEAARARRTAARPSRVPDPLALARAAIGGGGQRASSCSTWRGLGRGAGLNLDLLSPCPGCCPRVRLLAGGGVQGDGGPRRARAHSACDGVLVATALHDGRLRSRPDVSRERATWGRWPTGRSSPPPRSRAA